MAADADTAALLRGEHGLPEQLAVSKDLCIVSMYVLMDSWSAWCTYMEGRADQQQHNNN